MPVANSEENDKRKVSLVLDVGLEDRLHRLRGSGRHIRSFAAVARDVLTRGLAELEGEAAEGAAARVETS